MRRVRKAQGYAYSPFMRHIFLLLTILAGCFIASAQHKIIPHPVETKVLKETSPIVLNDSTGFICNIDQADFQREANQLKAFLSHGTGLKLNGTGGLTIIVKKDDSLKPHGPEAYRITLTRSQIIIGALTPKGIFYAGQSLAQMLPADFFNKHINKSHITWQIAAQELSILDYPRFQWRAFMLDEARHFFGEEALKRIIDQMALLKMNVLHWHLTDDVGWRIEIKKYPKLTQIGSKRRDTELETWGSGKYSGEPHAGFYTQEQIKRIVRYAADRHITIVPEFDIPGHSAAAIVSYPELQLSARMPHEVPVSFNHGAAFDPTKEQVYRFIEDIITEMMSLFPAKIIHIGGDEVRYKKYWEGVPHIERFMKEKNIAKFTDLQMMFTNRITAMLTKKGYRVVGWNEILGADIHQDGNQGSALGVLNPNAIIHFWYGNPSLAVRAAEKGHSIINSTSKMTYLDKNEKKLPLETAYSFEPIFKGLPAKHHHRVIGLGCQLWTEWIRDEKTLHRHLFPRIAAYAETGWSRKDAKNYKNFLERLQAFKQILKMSNIAFSEAE